MGAWQMTEINEITLHDFTNAYLRVAHPYYDQSGNLEPQVQWAKPSCTYQIWQYKSALPLHKFDDLFKFTLKSKPKNSHKKQHNKNTNINYHSSAQDFN